MPRIAVTGLGVIAPGGTDAASLWESVCAGENTVDTPLALPGSSMKVAEIRDNSFLNELLVKPPGLDRSAQFAVFAATQAFAMAGLSSENVDPARVAVIIGNGGAGLTTLDEQYRRLFGDKQNRLHPLSVAKSMSSSSASWVSIATGMRGPTFVIASACASGAHAIGIAAELIRSGLADVAIAGGAEAPLAEGTMRAWESMRILAPDRCRPFGQARQGLTLGEGAGIVILESDTHARGRGAEVHAYLTGFSCSADAGDMFNPVREGMAQVMRDAIKKAGLAPSDIGYINAHGTATVANDVTETLAVKDVYGRETAPPISSTKCVTGHGLGAAGGVEAVISVLALRNGVIPPTANFDVADPECDLDYVPNTKRKASLKAVQSNSFAFGGLNASLVFTSPAA